MGGSNSLTEAILLKLLSAFYRRGNGSVDPDELEIVDCDMRCFGQWRLILWVRAKEGKPLSCRYGTSLHTFVIHESSVVEVVADAPPPERPKE